jgi:8-amino-7-oxononanoate synthase
VTSGSNLAQRLQERLSERHAAGLYRRRELVEQVDGARARIGGRWYVNFSSNDYLGLSQHPDIAAALSRVGFTAHGAGASPLVSGYTTLHQEVETAVANYLGLPAALLCSSGYCANLGLLGALLERGEAVFHDRHNHASLLDATRLAGARLRRYPHLDTKALRRQLRKTSQVARLLVTEGVFSMDGDLAPLPELADCAELYGLSLVVDDAHGFGVLGQNGRGSVEAFGLPPSRAPIRIITFGKALGLAGACIVGPEQVIDALVQFARPYIYSTACSPAMCSALLAALAVLRNEAWRRQRLGDLVNRFQAAARQRGIPVSQTDGPIQPLILGNVDTALRAAAALRSSGFLVKAFRPPTVPAGTARLRISFSALHDDAHIDGLVAALAALLSAA